MEAFHCLRIKGGRKYLIKKTFVKNCKIDSGNFIIVHVTIV